MSDQFYHKHIYLIIACVIYVSLIYIAYGRTKKKKINRKSFVFSHMCTTWACKVNR